MVRMGDEKMMKEYLPTELCKNCGGKCCKKIPAPYLPSDIRRIFGDIEKAVKSGMVAIDWWEGDNPLYFMRPKTIKTDDLYDPSWGGQCIHLTETGCALPRNQRPHHCKTPEPKENDECDSHFKKNNSKYWAGIAFKRAKIDLKKWR